MGRLTVKDLINVGIFTVLYFAVIAVVGRLGALLPMMQILGPLYIPIVSGVPFMAFLTRVKHPGMVTIMGLLVGLLFMATGQSHWVLVLAVVLAPAADAIMASGRYVSWKRAVLGFVVFAEMAIGTVVPLFFTRAEFQAAVAKRHPNDDWVRAIDGLTPAWMFPVMIAMLAVGAVCGAFLGRAVLRKHFARAGIV